MLSSKQQKVSNEIRDRLKSGGVPARYVSVTCHKDGNVEFINIRIIKGMETQLPNGEMLFFYVAKLVDEMKSKYNNSHFSVNWVN